MTGLLLLLAIGAPHGEALSDCEVCHQATGWHDLKPAADGFDHDATGFPLRAAHARARCVACHQGRSLRDAPCTQCHSDPHQGSQGAGCDRCHSQSTWAIPRALADHRRTRLPLVGLHAVVPCRDCHGRLVGEVWTPVPARCEACHAGEARRPGVHPDHAAAGFSSRCDDCHTPRGWRPATVVHDRYWFLEGVHRTVPCTDCHAEARYAGTPRFCSHCHMPEFERAHDAGDSLRCEQCHGAKSWQPVAYPGHDRLFPLPHEGVERCRSCHPDGEGSLSCMTCHTHSKSRMDSKHKGFRGYAYEARACLRCHPRGEE